MDVRALGIDLQKRRVALTLRGAAGDTAHELAGEAAARVLAELAALRAALGDDDPFPSDDRGALLRLSVNPLVPSLRIEREGGTELVEGAPCQALLPLLREAARIASREARPRVPDQPGARDDAELWERKYQAGSDGWELMRPAPPLVRYLAVQPPAPGARALVPGCGRGHEARLLARLGAKVSAIDIAPSAIAECRRLAEEEGLADSVEALPLDLFALPEEHRGAYDLVVEHTCFCAIDPGRRGEYAAAAAAALRPGGRLVGLFWCHDYPGGPPYGARQEEVERTFLGPGLGDGAAPFRLRHGEVPPDSILTRAGHELLLDMEKTDAL